MQLHKYLILVLLAGAPLSGMSSGQEGLPEDYCRWEVVDYAIVEPLCGLAGDVQRGREIASDGYRGNCLACHQIEGGTLPGNIGPPLVAMKARFPDYAKLRSQIYDSRKNNPNTIMIPFGPHNVMSSEEIDLVTKFIHTL